MKEGSKLEKKENKYEGKKFFGNVIFLNDLPQRVFYLNLALDVVKIYPPPF